MFLSERKSAGEVHWWRESPSRTKQGSPGFMFG